MLDGSILELFAKAGIMRWPLLLCSLFGLAIIVDRSIIYFRARFRYDHFMYELGQKVRQRANGFQQALGFCRENAHPLATVAGSYLETLEKPDPLRTDLIKRTGSMELERLERRLRMLSAIAHLSPLMGLLGTVMGMVSAFAQIDAGGGNVQPGELASGIWEALLTTVMGLAIAIPCMAAFHAFESHADRVARQMQFAITSLDEWCGRTTSQSPQSQTDAPDNTGIPAAS
jgi:biopolymer transport protein ExbB